ncbi:MAG: DUF1836 domain-containing protein [Ruminococcaceae bacterium]|nr:DUF1836 domain-containing protein [Oscillospiraceae bacterium]
MQGGVNILISCRCPCWATIPDIELYMDQVVSVLEKELEDFVDPDTKSVTSTMINNYVKQKLVPPPVNKKYSRGHIASFYIITLLKQIMPIPDITRFINYINAELGSEKAFDLFCTTMEKSLYHVFTLSGFQDDLTYEGTPVYSTIKSLCMSYAHMRYAMTLLDEHAPAEIPEEKDKDKEKDKKEKKEKKKK